MGQGVGWRLSWGPACSSDGFIGAMGEVGGGFVAAAVVVTYSYLVGDVVLVASPEEVMVVSTAVSDEQLSSALLAGDLMIWLVL